MWASEESTKKEALATSTSEINYSNGIGSLTLHSCLYYPEFPADEKFGPGYLFKGGLAKQVSLAKQGKEVKPIKEVKK